MLALRLIALSLSHSVAPLSAFRALVRAYTDRIVGLPRTLSVESLRQFQFTQAVLVSVSDYTGG